jgi:hypothetical protein
MRYDAFGSLPGGHVALNSSIVFALKCDANQRRASRMRVSRRIS